MTNKDKLSELGVVNCEQLPVYISTNNSTA